MVMTFGPKPFLFLFCFVMLYWLITAVAKGEPFSCVCCDVRFGVVVQICDQHVCACRNKFV